jgi:hypothetical protein
MYTKYIFSVGCNSIVGRLRKETEQELSLQRTGCINEATVIHEFIHALGLILFLIYKEIK